MRHNTIFVFINFPYDSLCHSTQRRDSNIYINFSIRQSHKDELEIRMTPQNHNKKDNKKETYTPTTKQSKLVHLHTLDPRLPRGGVVQRVLYEFLYISLCSVESDEFWFSVPFSLEKTWDKKTNKPWGSSRINEI